jgi:signal transduction histidine kinase
LLAVNDASPRFSRLLADLLVLSALVFGSFLLSQLLFSYSGLIVPVVVPALALSLGAIAAVIWEREKDREESFAMKIRSAEDRLRFAHEKFEADLKTQEAEAKAREVIKDQERRKEFVRRINHDLNAPVSVLNWTLVELQGDELPSTEAQEKIHRLMTNSDRLCELIDELVQTYDYDAEKEAGNENVDHCELSELLVDLVDLEQPLASMRESTIELHDGIENIEVMGSRQEIMRVFDNLVRNALKHNDEGTHVRLSASTADETCTIKIEDNGKGIQKEHLEHIFESGYRVPESNSDGQGLGLDIVRNLVERVNGQIAVESIPGTGTTFSVTLRRHLQND